MSNGPKKNYDFIIVGAGAASSVLAAELSASGAQVLVIESGGPDDGPTIANPSVWFYNVGGPLDYHLAITPLPQLNNRKFYMALGHVLGGGSTINAMVWGAVMDAIDAAVVAFFQKFLEPPKVPVAPLDNELSNLLRFLRADNRQAFDRSCTKETLDVERLPGFMGENRRRRKPTVEQLSRGQANSQRCRSGWGLHCFQHKG